MVGVRLFVGNLPYTASEESLRELLSQAGDVRAVAIPLDRITQRSRGFALVDVASEADAREIIREFSGYVLDTRRLRVELAREPEALPAPRYRPFTRPRGRPETRPRRPGRSPAR